MSTKTVKYQSLVILLLSFFSFSIKGQLKVHIAPEDTTYCSGLYFEEFALGSGLEIEDGEEPYEIEWECNIPITSSITVTADGLFVDKTVSDPIFKTSLWDDWYKIKVNVRDKLNNFASDSVNIRFSRFSYSLGYIETTIELGDSLYIEDPNIGGGINPLSYEYFPKHGVSNPYSLGTWVKPSETTIYDIQATDSCGCISELNTVIKIDVITTNLPIAKSKNPFNVRIIGNKLYFDNPELEETSINIYSINGKKVLHKETKTNSVDISILKDNPSLYVIKTIRGNFMDIRKLKK